MDIFHIGSQVGFNISITLFLYVALSLQIGRVRKDIRRLAKRKRSGRRQSCSDPQESR